MIRNLKILMLSAMALAAFGAFSAPGASAAEFHCEVAAGESCIVTLSPDGSGKTSHKVFIVKKGPFSAALTCNAHTGSGTAAKTSTSLTITNLVYIGCNLAGTEASVTTTGCDFLFNANGGKVDVGCEGANKIKMVAGGCTVEVGPQALSGITYTNINSKKEITVSTAVKNISGTVGAGCAGLIGFTGAFTEGEYTTGNAIIKAFKDVSGAEGAQVNGWWE